MPYFSCACFLLLDHFHLASNAHDTQKPICLDGKEKTWNINTKHCHRQVIRNQRKLRGGFFSASFSFSLSIRLSHSFLAQFHWAGDDVLNFQQCIAFFGTPQLKAGSRNSCVRFFHASSLCFKFALINVIIFFGYWMHFINSEWSQVANLIISTTLLHRRHFVEQRQSNALRGCKLSALSQVKWVSFRYLIGICQNKRQQIFHSAEMHSDSNCSKYNLMESNGWQHQLNGREKNGTEHRNVRLPNVETFLCADDDDFAFFCTCRSLFVHVSRS